MMLVVDGTPPGAVFELLAELIVSARVLVMPPRWDGSSVDADEMGFYFAFSYELH